MLLTTIPSFLWNSPIPNPHAKQFWAYKSKAIHCSQTCFVFQSISTYPLLTIKLFQLNGHHNNHLISIGSQFNVKLFNVNVYGIVVEC